MVGVIMINCELLIINEALFRVGAEYTQRCSGKGLESIADTIRYFFIFIGALAWTLKNY